MIRIKYIAVLLLISFYLSFAGEKKKENEYVKFKVKLEQNKFKPGTNAELQFSLVPQKGIHVNLDPPISLKMDSSEAVAKLNELVIPQADKKPYLNSAKPIIQPIVISKIVKTGSYTLKGVLSYFYCSDADGWCSRFKQPFEINIQIIK